MNFAEKLANVVNRYNEVEALISAPNLNSDELVRMNKELACLLYTSPSPRDCS